MTAKKPRTLNRALEAKQGRATVFLMVHKPCGTEYWRTAKQLSPASYQGCGVCDSNDALTRVLK